MLLSDGELRLAIAVGELSIIPALPSDSDQIKAASIDLRLGQYIWTQKVHGNREPDGGAINDISDFGFQQYMENCTEQTNIGNSGGFLIKPGDFVITQTMERVRLGRMLSGRVEGRSRLARMGVGVHVTAPKIDPGFDGHITLEMFHMGSRPIFLQHLTPICTLLVERLGIPAGSPYQGMFNTGESA